MPSGVGRSSGQLRPRIGRGVHIGLRPNYISLDIELRPKPAAAGTDVAFGRQPWQFGATRGATPWGHTRSFWGAERPYFTGLSRSRFIVAEREGLPRRSQKPNKIRHFLQARWRRVYQSCVPKSTGFPPSTTTKCIQIRCGDLMTLSLYQFEAVSLRLSI